MAWMGKCSPTCQPAILFSSLSNWDLTYSISPAVGLQALQSAARGWHARPVGFAQRLPFLTLNDDLLLIPICKPLFTRVCPVGECPPGMQTKFVLIKGHPV
jgi:hypothetical protein